MSITRLWAFIAIALPILAAIVTKLPATDLAYHLRAGAEILDTGRVPTTDTWTFTAAGTPWFDQQWGAQVVLAIVYQLGSWTALVLLRAVLVGAIVTMLFVLLRRQAVERRLAALLTLGAFVVSIPALALRPQLFAMVLFAAMLLLLGERRRNPRLLWLLPLIGLAWGNLHGSFVLVPVVLGLTALADFAEMRRSTVYLRAFAMPALATVLATCVTPFGPTVWIYAAGLGANPEVARRITEWQPAALRDFAGWAFFGSALVVAAAAARRHVSISWPTLAWLGTFFLLGAYASRGIAWWPLALIAVTPELIGARLNPVSPRVASRGVRTANVAIAAGLVVAGIALLPIWRPIDPRLGVPADTLSFAPPEITAGLRDIVGPDDRILNSQPWGSWFEFAFPETAVAIDSRIELFPSSVWTDYDIVTTGRPGWREVLDRWDPTIVVTAASEGRDFADRLIGIGWQESYDGPEGLIVVRSR